MGDLLLKRREEVEGRLGEKDVTQYILFVKQSFLETRIEFVV